VVTISVGGNKVSATTDAAGNWEAKLPAMEVGGPLTITVAGSSTKTLSDVLVGEVWVCSGQSNMQWSVAQSNDPDLERLAANFPKIRMINFPQTGSQEPIWSHDDRKWMVCNPENNPKFSAVGYFFARQIHQTTGVPIGMINNAWGGSACESWVNLDVLKAEGHFNKINSKISAIKCEVISVLRIFTTACSSPTLATASKGQSGIKVNPMPDGPINTAICSR